MSDAPIYRKVSVRVPLPTAARITASDIVGLAGVAASRLGPQRNLEWTLRTGTQSIQAKDEQHLWSELGAIDEPLVGVGIKYFDGPRFIDIDLDATKPGVYISGEDRDWVRAAEGSFRDEIRRRLRTPWHFVRAVTFTALTLMVLIPALAGFIVVTRGGRAGLTLVADTGEPSAAGTALMWAVIGGTAWFGLFALLQRGGPRLRLDVGRSSARAVRWFDTEFWRGLLAGATLLGAALAIWQVVAAAFSSR